MNIDITVRSHGLSSENVYGIAILQVLKRDLESPNAFWASPLEYCLYAETDEDINYLRSWIYYNLRADKNMLSDFDE